ncbi:MAG TPA: DUF1670 domain-containing protein, partial [Dissulfurispiraceae bacterium]|nr:DUF1670 domain-containing protein [Dissulfurispiraceae bacterium]
EISRIDRHSACRRTISITGPPLSNRPSLHWSGMRTVSLVGVGHLSTGSTGSFYDRPRDVLEIARQTHHAPRSVDSYLKAFDGVLILHLYGMDPVLMATVLRRGEYLVNEYLDVITRYLKDAETMREYLRKQGVQLPPKIAYSG